MSADDDLLVIALGSVRTQGGSRDVGIIFFSVGVGARSDSPLRLLSRIESLNWEYGHI